MIENSSQLENFTIMSYNSAQIEDVASTLNEEQLPKPIWRSSKPKKAFNGYNYEGGVYKMEDLNDFLEIAFRKAPLKRVNSRVLFYNIPCSFDIETTSFYIRENDETEELKKQAIMYIWQFGINGYTIIGRTWFEFGEFINALVNYAKLSTNCRLLIYVHNLSFEFQFIKNWFKWDKVFSMKKRRPVTAISGGLEFRCSYYLSNYNLAYLGSNLLQRYKVNKLVGNLDYNLVRHSKTPLTQDEIDYAVNDVRVVMAYIQEKIEDEDGITNIPLTNTGYVRRHCREKCFGIFKNATQDDIRNGLNYKAVIKSLNVSSYEEYQQLQNAFMGGFTHANINYVNKTLENVDGNKDIASSYPRQLVLNYFPKSSSIYIGKVSSPSQLEFYLKHYCCLFDIYIENIRPLVTFENILSVSRCKFLDTNIEHVANNGRLVSYAGCLKTTVTELDYENLMKFYDWDGIYITNLRIYERGYLPTPLVKSILEFYEIKTSKKDVEGHETEYMVSKNMINSIFGMIVTDIIRDEFDFDSAIGWTVEQPDGEESITYYNKNFNRFLFYPWGVWVTAHARNALFDAIYELGDDYIYADTDCVKYFNKEKHEKYFERVNAKIKAEAIKSSVMHNIPLEYYIPKTKKGQEKLIGIWEDDYGYKKFKTIGAKRYLFTTIDENGEEKLGMTVAGVNKRTAIPYLLKTYKDIDSVFTIFEDGMFIPSDSSGKLTHTYIDDVQSGFIVDYLGKKAEYYEKSSTHLEPASFTMSMTEQYLKLIEGVVEIGTFEKF